MSLTDASPKFNSVGPVLRIVNTEPLYCQVIVYNTF